MSIANTQTERMTADEFFEWASRPENDDMDYLGNGAALVWIIDPERRTVTVYTADNGPRVFGETQTLNGGNLLPGLKCRVADFFRLPGDKRFSSSTRKP